MAEQRIRERLAGCWRLVSYKVTPVEGGEAQRPLGDHPLGTILYTPDGYMSAQLARQGPYDHDDQQPDAYYIAYSGPYDVDEQARTVTHQVQVSVIPGWLDTTQLRQVQFPGPGTLVLSTSEQSPPPRRGDDHDDDQLVTTATAGLTSPRPRTGEMTCRPAELAELRRIRRTVKTVCRSAAPVRRSAGLGSRDVDADLRCP